MRRIECGAMKLSIFVGDNFRKRISSLIKLCFPLTIGSGTFSHFNAAANHQTTNLYIAGNPVLISLHQTTPDFWRLSNPYLIGAVVVILIEVLLISWLLILRRRRSYAEKERKRLASMVDAEHRHLEEVVSNVPGVVWETRIDPVTKVRRIVFISHQVEEMLGFPHDSWLSSPAFCFDVMHDEDRDRMIREVDELVARDTEGTTQFRWVAKDGHVLWVEAHIVPVHDDSGNLVGMRGVTLDITPYKQAENAWQQSEQRNSAILRAIPDLMFLQTVDGTYVDYHAKNPKDLLVAPDVFLGKNMKDVLPSKLATDLSVQFRRAVETGEPQVLEYEIELNGSRHWYEARIVTCGDKILSVVRDVTQKKSAELTVRASEVTYRSIFNAVNDSIFIHNLETGEILDVNERMCEMYGFTVEEAMRLKVGDLSSNEAPYTQDVALKWIQKAATEGPQLFEWHAKHKSGRLFWVEVGLKRTLIGDKDCMLAVVRDITERKHVTDELRQSEARFSKAFRANPQPMSITSLAEGRYIDVNESFLAMSGYTLQEVLGHTSLELKVWETPETRAEFVRALIERGAIVNMETKFRTKSGSFRVLLSSAEQLEIAGEKCLLVSSSDITERMSAQQALRESEERFRNMADTAPVMIWIAADDKNCTYFNQQWFEFTGRTLAEEWGFGWADGVYREDLARCLETYNKSFDERKRFEMEYRLRRADGEYRWVLDCARPRFSHDGVFLGFIGSCIDITQRKESEQALRKAHEDLNALKNQLEAENIYLHQELQGDQAFGEIVGQSDAVKYMTLKINQIAPTASTVLIMGETGTGKELVARAVHSASERSDRPLIKVNCAALSPTLIESELFGHEKGAFTGAGARKIGRFELANRGTIFLDEIGELPSELQVKLLRVIQEGEFERVGGTKTLKVDVRIIAATNRNLKVETEKGTFRQDLLYRLNVFPITVPPLRERREDIPLLVEHFAEKASKKLGKTITSVSAKAMRALREHPWPGNVRELANVIERAVIYTQGNTLHLADQLEHRPEDLPSPIKTLEEIEREHIIRTLESTGWRVEGQYGAAKILGINPSTLRTRMTKLQITRRRGTLGDSATA